jgi:GNAT superfamily N-acetyltransferase
VSALVLRPARPSEAPELTAIAQAAKRHWGYAEAWLAAWRESLTVTAEQVAEHTVLVADVGGVIAGFAVLADAGAHWSLEHLWVRPEHHGRGVGRALFEAIVRAAHERRAAPVRIESDPFAVGFYERCGARRVGVVPAPVLGAARELPVLEYPVPRES